MMPLAFPLHFLIYDINKFSVLLCLGKRLLVSQKQHEYMLLEHTCCHEQTFFKSMLYNNALKKRTKKCVNCSKIQIPNQPNTPMDLSKQGLSRGR